MCFCRVFGLSRLRVRGSPCGAGPVSTALVADMNWRIAVIGVAVMTMRLSPAQRRACLPSPPPPKYIQNCFGPQFHDTLFLMGRSKNSRVVWNGKALFLPLAGDTRCNLVPQNSMGRWQIGDKRLLSQLYETFFWFIKMCAKKDNSLPSLCFIMLGYNFYSLRLK